MLIEARLSECAGGGEASILFGRRLGGAQGVVLLQPLIGRVGHVEGGSLEEVNAGVESSDINPDCVHLPPQVSRPGQSLGMKGK